MIRFRTFINNSTNVLCYLNIEIQEKKMKTKYSTLCLCCTLALGAQAANESAVSKTDVLGRHVSFTRNVPKAYIKEVKKQANQKSDVTKVKSLMKPSDYPYYEEPMARTEGSFEYTRNERGAMVEKYTLNGTSLEKADYVSQIGWIEDNDRPRRYYILLNKMTCPNEDVDVFYTATEISDECSGRSPCVVPHIQVAEDVFEDIEYWNYTSIVENSNLYQYALKPGYRGRNIGISFTEAGLPLQSFLPAGRYVRLSSSHADAYDVPHGTKVARVLNRVAPSATLYGYQNSQRVGTACHDRPIFIPDDGYDMNPKIFIGNHSYGRPNAEYVEDSKYMDNFIYDTRTIEFASIGNSGLLDGGQSSEIGMGVNVISVGAVHNNMTYHQTSSWRNPAYRKKDGVVGSGLTYVKPEVANFSDFVFSSDKAYSIGYNRELRPKNTSTYTLNLRFHQTSSATPYMSASVALLLDRFPFYKWHPEVVKALLITSSVKSISNAELHDPDNVSAGVAMGVPEGRAMFLHNRSRFWNGNNGDFFDENGYIMFTEGNIKKGKRYRVAISWLSSGNYVYEYGKLPQDIDLFVYQNGSQIAYSYSGPNPFEFAEFVAENDSDVQIRISRYRNDGGRVLLGYNLVEVN